MWTATPKAKWKVDDATLFPLILLMLGPVPESGWKFLSDEHTTVHFTASAARAYKREIDRYLADHYYAGSAYDGHAVNNFVRAKRNQFFKWIWNTRFPDAMRRDRNYPPRHRRWGDDKTEEVTPDEDDLLKAVDD